MYGLFDPSGKMLRLSVDHRRLRPVDDMEGQQAMNRDKGSYQLSHAYDCFLDKASYHCVKNGDQHLLMASDRGRNVKFLGNNFGCV